jgi:hypothetical protein
MVQVDVAITTQRQLLQESQVVREVLVKLAKVETSLLQRRVRMALWVRKAAMEVIGVQQEVRV